MKATRLERRRALEQQGRTVEFGRLDFEMVTDSILQLQVYFDVSPGGFEEAAWTLALTVDAVALAYDTVLEPAFAAFGLSFDQARTMVSARPTGKRKEAVSSTNLPPFFGGSRDPS